MMPIPFKTKCIKTCKGLYCKPCWVKDKEIINRIEFFIIKTIIMSINIASICASLIFQKNLNIVPRLRFHKMKAHKKTLFFT